MKWQNSSMMMFIGSIIIGYFITSSLLVNDISDVKNSLTKFYSAIWMALWMVVLELLMFTHMNKEVPISAYVITFVLIAIIFYCARRQVMVDDKQYLQAMIQHHSSAILTSDAILQKTRNDKVKKLATWISKSQQKEIDDMNKLLNEI
jgi:hypothetical protein